MTENDTRTSNTPAAMPQPRNQCDGCCQGAAVNEYGNHVNQDGRPFMSCTRYLYEGTRSHGTAAAPAAEPPIAIPGLGRMTDEDDGYVTLQFKDEAAAQAFMHGYGPSVEVEDMPPNRSTGPAATEQGAESSLASDFSEFLYRVASQVPFEHASWAQERGGALLAAIKRLTASRQPPALSDDELDELHERLERKVNAAIKADPASTGGVKVERRMYLRELLAAAHQGL